ncbi:MAG TPA: hypothetical protein VFC07_00800 [Verrucomicrobiae bacterium]|nr:hypothetical protein [Verrucomicrobiae bacterium]
MPETPPNTELLRSLGQLVRGLSALFWGLPLALIICVQTAKTEMLRPFNILPPMVVTGWLVFGLWQLGHFQKQERIWMSALDRAKLIALVNLGLSPFLYWWSQMPDEPFYTAVLSVMAVSGLLFLSNLNTVLQRLSAMLPDEGLRQETKHFTTLNRFLVLAILLVGLVFYLLVRFPEWLPTWSDLLGRLESGTMWLMIFLVLLPLAMTMALIWKIKEVILDGLFGMGR